MNKKIFFLIFFILILIGSVPKILRFIETDTLKEPVFIAYYEVPRSGIKIPDIELSGELKPYYFAEIYPRIDRK